MNMKLSWMLQTNKKDKKQVQDKIKERKEKHAQADINALKVKWKIY
jgi:hypothetical protein